MALKPLVRWTVGAVHPAGFELLRESVEGWLRLYGDAFDAVICHNSLAPAQLLQVRACGLPLLDQTPLAGLVPARPSGCAWKLVPPRLRPESHEVFIDNDLVLHDRVPAVDQFLAGYEAVVTEAHRAHFGAYAGVLGCDRAVNTGLFGLPPGFDLSAKVWQLARLYPRLAWDGHDDDQGVVMAAVRSLTVGIIPLADVWVCNPTLDFAPYGVGRRGTHFAGANAGNVRYWERYKGAR